MPPDFSALSTPHLKRVMIFIDGGYFRKIVDKKFGDRANNDPAIMSKALNHLISKIQQTSFAPHSKSEIVRAYYYDARFPPEDPEHIKQSEYFKEIQKSITYPFEMKYGRLVRAGKDGEKIRQKGVDVLLSVDMVVKAFLNHYDFAVLIAGDQDFLDAVRVVKDLAGKKVVGYYDPTSTSKELIESFDYKFPILPSPFFNDLRI
ncbi:hypothetical protein DRP04_11395 [Archaeoglobales archaeon]|nr:MAG: hypothetical protein DRP04_11395 [Archaeoglobales archaeon]